MRQNSLNTSPLLQRLVGDVIVTVRRRRSFSRNRGDRRHYCGWHLNRVGAGRKRTTSTYMALSLLTSSRRSRGLRFIRRKVVVNERFTASSEIHGCDPLVSLTLSHVPNIQGFGRLSSWSDPTSTLLLLTTKNYNQELPIKALDIHTMAIKPITGVSRFQTTLCLPAYLASRTRCS